MTYPGISAPRKLRRRGLSFPTKTTAFFVSSLLLASIVGRRLRKPTLRLYPVVHVGYSTSAPLYLRSDRPRYRPGAPYAVIEPFAARTNKTFDARKTSGPLLSTVVYDRINEEKAARLSARFVECSVGASVDGRAFACVRWV